MSERIIAASIAYIDPASSPQAGVLYVSTESFTTDSGDTPPSTWFDGRLTGDIDYNFQVRAPFTGYNPRTGFGEMKLSNADGALDALLGYEIRDQAIVIKSLEPGQDWSAGTVLATTLGDFISASGLDQIVISLRDPAAILDTPLARETWAAGGNFDDAAGKIKPVAFGTPLNCKPVAVRYEILRYDCHDDALVDVADVRVDGVSVPYSVVGGGVSGGITLQSEPDGEVLLDPVATGTANISSFVEASPLDLNIEYSDLFRTMQNTSRRYDSPLINYEFTNHVPNGKPASAGGKFYFEAYVNRFSQTDANLTPYKYGSAVGIGPDPTDPNAQPRQADQYTLWVCQDGGFGGRVVTYGDTSVEDSIQSAGLTGGTWDGAVIGVEVDLDAFTVRFKVWEGATLKWTSSTISITQNSPLDTFYPLGAVVGNPNTDTRDQDNKITLFTQPENFEQDIPSGFEAWGESAYSASTQFSDLVASITDRIPGLTIDTTTQTQIDALGYSYSYYVDDTTPAAQLLYEACASFGGWYYVTRTGAVAFGQLKEPSAVGNATFTSAELIRFRVLDVDYAEGLSNRMGALRNWTRSNRDTLDASLTEAQKDTLSRNYRHEAVSDNTLASIYAPAIGGPLAPSLFRVASDADTEIDRMIALFDRQRLLIEVDVAFDLSTYTAITLGSSVAISFERYGLGDAAEAGAFSDGFSDGFDIGVAGRTYLVLGIRGNFSSSRMRLVLWG